jgi:hypothetical protein
MMEPHMIENYIFIVFMIVVNHVGFIIAGNVSIPFSLISLQCCLKTQP